MGSQNLRNTASFKMHKNRKKLWLEEVNKRILLLENKTYKIGLSHIENVLLPSEGIKSEGEDGYIFSSNHIFIERKLSKMSSDLKYNVILAFNEETFNYFNLENIRCPSLTKYITDKIIPRIIIDLKLEKRKNELALRIIKPTTEEIEERKLRRMENEKHRQLKEVKRLEIIPGKINYIKKHTNIEKNKKYMQLKDQNEKHFKEKISFMHIHINNIGQNANKRIPSEIIEEQEYENQENEEQKEINKQLSPVQEAESPVFDSDSDSVVQDQQYSSYGSSEYSGECHNEIDSDLVDYFRGSSEM